MNTLHRLAALALLTAGLATGAAAPAMAQANETPRHIAAAPTDPGEAARQFEAAMEAYERNHWLEAFTALARLADHGHAEAARIASLMQRHGTALYGMHFATAPGQLQRWAGARGRQLGLAQ
jgi:hypothetical protein